MMVLSGLTESTRITWPIFLLARPHLTINISSYLDRVGAKSSEVDDMMGLKVKGQWL